MLVERVTEVSARLTVSQTPGGSAAWEANDENERGRRCQERRKQSGAGRAGRAAAQQAQRVTMRKDAEGGSTGRQIYLTLSSQESWGSGLASPCARAVLGELVKSL